MDRYSYLIDPQHRFLLIGIVLLIMTAASMLSGEALERWRVVYPVEQPRRFWWDVALLFLFGFFLIGLYVYQNSN
jgi:hypothetical protein